MEIFSLKNFMLNMTSELLLKVGNMMVINGLCNCEIKPERAPPRQGTLLTFKIYYVLREATLKLCQSPSCNNAHKKNTKEIYGNQAQIEHKYALFYFM